MKASQLSKNRLAAVFLPCIGCILIYCSVNGLDSIYTIVRLAASVFGILISPVIPMCIGFYVSSFQLETSSVLSFVYWGLSTVPILIRYLLHKKSSINRHSLIYLVFVLISCFASYMLGYQTQLSTLAIQIMILLMFLSICECRNEHDLQLIFNTFLYSNIILGVVVLFQIITGNATYLWGIRLSFNGSVRTLSSALIIPIFYCLTKLFSRRDTALIKAVELFIIAVFTMILIFTYSRAVLITLVLVCSYYLFKQMREFSKTILFWAIILISVSIYGLSRLSIDTKQMTHELYSGSGRIEIWSYYIQKMIDRGPICFLVGFGPGNTLRVVADTVFDGYYAHSLFIDYLISYGIIGFSLLLYVLFMVLRKVWQSGNYTLMCYFAITIGLFLTHGNSATLDFFIWLAWVFAMSFFDNEVKCQ